MSTDLKEVVKEKYGQAALRVAKVQGNGCCGASPLDGCDPITSHLTTPGRQASCLKI